jgi:hypothetical protein
MQKSIIGQKEWSKRYMNVQKKLRRGIKSLELQLQLSNYESLGDQKQQQFLEQESPKS